MNVPSDVDLLNAERLKVCEELSRAIRLFEGFRRGEECRSPELQADADFMRELLKRECNRLGDRLLQLSASLTALQAQK